jgi:hypothetical protein
VAAVAERGSLGSFLQPGKMAAEAQPVPDGLGTTRVTLATTMR